MSAEPGWGHARGLLNVTPAQVGTETPPGARTAMIDRMSRYAWAFDERRADLLADNFTEDATWTAHFADQPQIGPHVGRAAVVDFMSGFWDVQSEQRRHMIFNHIVTEATEREGEILSYHLLVSTNDGVITPVTTGFYVVRMRHEDDGAWRISSLVAGYDIPF